MYSLDCSYYKAEFETIDELIEAATINGMDPNYEITFDGEGIGEQLIDLIQFSPSMQQPRLFHYLPKVYTKHCEKAVNMA
jgi:hypothetical protein